MTTFKVGDKVRFKQDQDFDYDDPLNWDMHDRMIDKYRKRGDEFKVRSYSDGQNILNVVGSDGACNGWFPERFELVPVPIPPGNATRWGSADPVTSRSPRKISDEERRLIEERIAARRKIRGDFS